MSNLYILEGKTPVRAESTLSWGRWFEANGAKRLVAGDKLDGGVRVSTVFLGVDHSFGGGDPLLFETMIFEGPHADYQERYSTWAEAEAGHARALALAKTPPSQNSLLEKP